MPPTHLPLVVRLGGIRALLRFCAIMTAGLVAALSPVAVVVFSNQEQSLKAELIAKETIKNLNL